MLKVINLNKTYKPKKGLPVNAINDVNINFGNTGLVFLLGKSGSGKSTLLNLIGGLDKFDSGDILIDGKSTKTFNQSDFDNYRNTYVGFIFQEYNLIDNMTVEKNIYLSLELQGKKKDEQKLKEVLSLVELSGYENRNMNELSGGQKQRVAIARSLIKNPEILLADEPTGALDKNTGFQILQTLKKLSENRLVIIVSHDKESAYNFGDRIIELEDGKVISDTIKNDNNLNYDESYFENNKTTVSKINKNKENQNNFKVIKSNLNTKRAVSIGIGSLKHKKIKLSFTILLMIISFAMLGFFISLTMVNTYDIAVKATYNLPNKTFTIQKSSNRQKFNEKSEHFSSFGQSFTKEDYEKLSSQLKSYNAVASYKTNFGYYQLLSVINDKSKIDGIYNFNGISILSGFEAIEADNETLKTLDATISAGKIPTENNEIAITNYLFNLFKLTGLKDLGKEIKTYDDIINFEILIKTKKYKIVGIINSNIDLSKFNSLKNVEQNSPNTFIEEGFLDSTISTSIAKNIIVKKNYINETEDALTLNKNEVSKFFINKGKTLNEFKEKTNLLSEIKFESEPIKKDKNTKNEIHKLNFKTSLPVFAFISIIHIIVSDPIFHNIIFGFAYLLLFFSIMLFMGYIGNSLSFRKKEIGILRSIGSRGVDIFKIFLTEGFFISSIASVLSFFVFLFLVNIINKNISLGIVGVTSLIPITFWHFLIFVGIGFITTIFSCAIPIYKMAKTKPIDIIYNK